MTALVQTIVQTRPSSSSGTSSFTSASQSSQSQTSRGHTMSLSSYNGMGGSTGYRNSVAPYAFTSTPGLVQPPRQPTSSQSSPASAPQGPQNATNGNPQRLQHFAAGSVSSSSSSTNSSHHSHVSQDDSVLASRRRTSDVTPRPLSTVNLPSQSPFLTLSSPSGSAKPSPDRYRRGNRRAENVAGGSNASVPVPMRSSSVDGSAPEGTAISTPTLSQPLMPRSAVQGHVRTPSADDTRQEKPQHPELAKRYRRRSWASLDAPGVLDSKERMPPNASLFAPLPDLKSSAERSRPPSAHSHRGSTDSSHSVRSSTPSVKREPGGTQQAILSKEETKTSTNISHTPSPLSNQMTSSDSSSSDVAVTEADVHKESVAGQRQADINKVAPKKSGKSRLRRAFSFGSASELRKLSMQNSIGKRELVDPDQSKQDAGDDELDPEQAAIAAQQEANGLGESIYTNQIFTGSTDNVSISSTASSASVMLRKMGRGMKKSTRSLVGLFRPKSFSSTRSESVVEPTAPKVSVVNIEAERKTVIANPNPHDQPRGGTVFPKLENITKDKAKPAAPVERTPVDNARARKSIVGGEKERAEVLAAVTAVKKGILKNSVKPAESQHANNSPHSSAPSTPDDHGPRAGHKNGSEDYFGKSGSSDSKSTTPQPVVTKTIVFSPRIQFHETWPSGEYDRRGEAATCNRLTPLLAQQIKEELNNFKMEMEVHETSKVYTHFL
ncbi:hypothetical protein VTN77DRAFT_3245 [Rasamsonia byssochlamydoides]|uniref:uncharacterized protein n=1 Tax=Rasamsonia byssochlamydoides TaxID=89139 RepID=UPI00374228D0